MRILIYDTNKHDHESLYQMIKLLPIQTIIDVASSYEDSIHMYSSFEYTKVFINFNEENGNEFEKFVLDKNPKQKLILLKEHYDCSLNHDCHFCQNNFNKFLVIKPINISQLPKIINNTFECEGYCKTLFDYNLEKINKTLKHKYPTIIYDKINYKFLLDEIPSSFVVELFIELTTLLSKYNIEYRIFENKSIQVIPEDDSYVI